MRLRPSLASVAALCGWVVVVVGIQLAAALRQSSVSVGLIVSFLLLIAVIAWCASFSLQLSDGLLTYSAPLRRRVTVRVQDVTEANIEFGPNGLRDRLKPTVRLVLKLAPGSVPPMLEINIKMCRRRDVALLLETLDRTTK